MCRRWQIFLHPCALFHLCSHHGLPSPPPPHLLSAFLPEFLARGSSLLPCITVLSICQLLGLLPP